MEPAPNAARARRDRLLDAAERLFAQHGYDGASLRQITRAAGVELGLANYHFGSKEELFRRALLRRAPQMIGDLRSAPDEVSAHASLAAVLQAYARPHLARLTGEDAGWKHYRRLAASTALVVSRPGLMAVVVEAYIPVMDRFREAIGSRLAGVEPEEIDRAFHLFRMAILSVTIDAGSGASSGASGAAAGEVVMDDVDHVKALAASLVIVFARGMEALRPGA